MRRAWERSFHAVFFGGAAGKTQRGGRYLPWRGGRGCVGAFFRTRRAGGGTAFLRHSLRCKLGQWARVFPGVFPSVMREGGVSVGGGRGGRRCLCARRGDGSMAWRGGFLHTLRGGVDARLVMRKGRPTRLRRGVFTSARRAGTARQAMSGDGAGSAEEVAAGGGVGVPCG